MCSRKRRWQALLGGAVALTATASAHAQAYAQNAGSPTATLRNGLDGLTQTSLNEKSNAELGGAGTVESSLVRDADAAQESFFRTFQNGIIRIPKVGYGQGQLTVSAPLSPGAGFSLFGLQGKPEDAELKIGNFYLDILSLSGSALWSDNINLVEVGKESEEIAVVRLQATVMYYSGN